MALGTFWFMFGFPIGKKIGKIIFLVDFSRQSKWQNQHFSKIFCGPPNLYLKKHSLGYQGNCLKKFGFVILIALKNQPEKWSPFFLPIGNQIKKCSSCHFMPQDLLKVNKRKNTKEKRQSWKQFVMSTF